MENTDEIQRKIRTHRIAREIVNSVVSGKITLGVSEQIAALSLPTLKQRWVRDQVRGIQAAGGGK